MAKNIMRSWREIKVMLKSIFSDLSDKDFDFKEDQRETMLDQLASKLKKTRSELDDLFSELQKY